MRFASIRPATTYPKDNNDGSINFFIESKHTAYTSILYQLLTVSVNTLCRDQGDS
jgi:hypothetical protein